MASDVTVYADRVERVSGSLLATAAKYRAVHMVARRFCFVAPAVLGTDGDRMIMECLDGLVSLRRAYLERQHGGGWSATFRKAGAVLAYLHTNMPESRTDWTPSTAFLKALRDYGWEGDWKALPMATLHGDYSFSNVHLTPEQEVAIIDPCPNKSSSYLPWERGPIYVDLGKFLACLEGQVPPRELPFLSYQASIDMQEEFLRSYEGITGQKIDRAAAHAFAYAAVTTQFTRRRPLTGWLKRGALYNRLRRNFPLRVKLRALAA